MERAESNKKKAEFVKWMGPILDALRKAGGSGTPRDIANLVANELRLPDAKRQETLKSGALKFPTQIAWAGQYMAWEGLLEFSGNKLWKITEKGQKATLTEEEAREIFLRWVDIILEERRAMNLKEDVDNRQVVKDKGLKIGKTASAGNGVPAGNSHRQQILELIGSLPSEGFERLCMRLLHESGFGKVSVIGIPNGDGIDGIGVLQINPFVSFKVLFQCKRSKESVSRAQVGDFRNAMIGRADKGIIITTGDFTEDAVIEADRTGAPPVELVDGEKLVEMFETIKMGLTPKTVYEVDHSFFQPFLSSGTRN
ncbi:MAG: restriction endonuclease [Desulfobacteraceae bacterium]|nr:restriction endonuclease [Desulfobacteraceae bacterium]